MHQENWRSRNFLLLAQGAFPPDVGVYGAIPEELLEPGILVRRLRAFGAQPHCITMLPELVNPSHSIRV
jgi:hypothetical protein